MSKLIFGKKATTLLPGKTEEESDLAYKKLEYNIRTDTVLNKGQSLK